MPLFARILICVVVIELLGFASGFSTFSSIKTWYADLEKPPGTPPNWLFGPAWTTLYALIGVAVALVWHKVEPGPQKKRALGWFTVQMVLNLLWTPVFFGMHRIGAALVVIIALWLTIVFTIIAFRKLNPVAGWLLVPYLLWVSYATYLNAGQFVLNG